MQLPWGHPTGKSRPGCDRRSALPHDFSQGSPQSRCFWTRPRANPGNCTSRRNKIPVRWYFPIRSTRTDGGSRLPFQGMSFASEAHFAMLRARKGHLPTGRHRLSFLYFWPPFLVLPGRQDLHRLVVRLGIPHSRRESAGHRRHHARHARQCCIFRSRQGLGQSRESRKLCRPKHQPAPFDTAEPFTFSLQTTPGTFIGCLGSSSQLTPVCLPGWHGPPPQVDHWLPLSALPANDRRQPPSCREATACTSRACYGSPALITARGAPKPAQALRCPFPQTGTCQPPPRQSVSSRLFGFHKRAT